MTTVHHGKQLECGDTLLPVSVAILAIFMTLVSGATAAAAQATPQSPKADPAHAPRATLDMEMPVDPLITLGQLDNGLRYYIRENGRPEQRAELRLVVKVGSVLEGDHQLGLAHFAEHMAFNGTRSFPKRELVKALESFGMRFGADINASTGFDETVYMLRIPTDSEEIVTTAFQILEDWAQAVTFDAEEIDKERGVVIEEWRVGLGAGSRIRDQQFPILFQGSRYADRLPIGTLEVLEGFDHETLRSFYRDWYRPDLMAVVAVGDLEAERVEQLVHQHFDGLTNPAQPRPRPRYMIPEHDETRFAFATDREATSSSVAVFHKMQIRPQSTHASYRRKIVEGLYNAMLNRRLTELSQQPGPPFLGASSDQGIFIPTSEIYVLGAAVPDGGIARGLEALYTESERISRRGFTASELDRQKRQILRQFERIYTEREIQDSSLYAAEYIRGFLEDESLPGIDYEWALYQRYVPEVTLEEVNAVGRTWVSDRNRVVMVTAPEREGLKLPEEDELLAVLERIGEREVEAYVDTVTEAPLMTILPVGGEIVSEAMLKELKLTEWELSNGVRVVIKPTDNREDQVLLRAFSPGGTSLASDEDYVAASSAVQVVSASGLGRFSAREITNMLAGKVVRVMPFIGPFEEGFSGTASPRDLETLFQLIYLRFTMFKSDPGVFRIITEQMRESLANRDVSPEAAFQEELQRTMSQGHFRRRPISVELVDEMDSRKSYRFYSDRFADASDFTFLLVGNVDPESIRPLVERYLGSLPSIGRKESWRDEGIERPSGIVRRLVHRGVEPKSYTGIIFTGDFEFDRLHNNAIGAMANVLQTRLRDVMREALGGTYSVQVSESTSRIPQPEYTLSIGFGSDPDRVEELVEVVFNEIRRMQADGPAAAELDAVRASLRRSYETSLRQNGFWVSQLANAYRQGRDPLELLAYEESLDTITRQMVQDAAIAYFDFKNFVQVSLFPEQMGGKR